MSLDWRAIAPVLRFDAVRTARRGRFALFRVLYTSLLLVVLFAVYTSWFGLDFAAGLASISEDRQIPINAQARFAAAFFHTFLAVQLGVMLLLTPAFLAGAIAEEREKGTLNDLLVTGLSPAAIIVGKLLSRLAHLVLLLLAGVPVLAILFLLGGVDPALLIAAFALTLLSMLSTAALSLAFAVNASRTGEAMLQGYAGFLAIQLLTVVPCFGCIDLFVLWPSGYTSHSFRPINAIRGYVDILALSEGGQLSGHLPFILAASVVLHGALTFFCLLQAIRALRPDPVTGVPDSPGPSARPVLGDTSPLLWKENRGEPLTPKQRDRRDLFQMGYAIGFTVSVTFLVTGFLASSRHDEKARNDIATGFRDLGLPFFVCIGLVRLTLRGAGTISTERQRQTLDSLLTTPLTNGEILRGKWLSCLAGQRGLNLVFGLFILTGVLLAALSPLGLLVILLDSAVLAAFAICLGMSVSVSSRSTFHATTTAFLLLVALTVGHWLLYPILSAAFQVFGRPDLVEPLRNFHYHGLTSPYSLATLATLGGSQQAPTAQVLAACTGTALRAILAAALWLWLQRRFRLLTGRRQ